MGPPVPKSELDRILREGSRAYDRRRSRLACPYTIGSAEERLWLIGFYDARMAAQRGRLDSLWA